MLVTLFKRGEVYFRLLGTNGYHAKAKNERFYCCVLSLPSKPQIVSLRIDDFCSTTPLDFVTCPLRMHIRELSSVAPKSPTMVIAICRRLKTAGRDDFFRSFGYFGEALERRARWDCILKADGGTDRKSFPSCGLLRCKAQESALQNEKPNLYNSKDKNSA